MHTGKLHKHFLSEPLAVLTPSTGGTWHQVPCEGKEKNKTHLSYACDIEQLALLWVPRRLLKLSPSLQPSSWTSEGSHSLVHLQKLLPHAFGVCRARWPRGAHTLTSTGNTRLVHLL